MDIRYCPKCGKAGLRHYDNEARDLEGLTSDESYQRWKAGEPTASRWGPDAKRWCPRCIEWVKPMVAPLDFYGRPFPATK